MKDLNRWEGIGRLGKDIELKYMPNGDAVANFSIACADDYKNKDGEKVSKTEWVNLVTFGKQAEICAQYLKKGSRIYVEGKLTTRSYEKDGQTRYVTEIRMVNMQMLDNKPQDGQQSPAANANDQRRTAPVEQEHHGTGFDDDIPFAPRHWKEG